jgi:hypothetical protein
MSNVTCSLCALGATPNDKGSSNLPIGKCALAAESVERIICRLEDAIADYHTIEGVQKDDVGLTAVVDQHFVQIPSCYPAVDYHGVYMWSAAQVDIPGVKGEQYMGPLRL